MTANLTFPRLARVDMRSMKKRKEQKMHRGKNLQMCFDTMFTEACKEVKDVIRDLKLLPGLYSCQA